MTKYVARKEVVVTSRLRTRIDQVVRSFVSCRSIQDRVSQKSALIAYLKLCKLQVLRRCGHISRASGQGALKQASTCSSLRQVDNPTNNCITTTQRSMSLWVEGRSRGPLTYILLIRPGHHSGLYVWSALQLQSPDIRHRRKYHVPL